MSGAITAGGAVQLNAPGAVAVNAAVTTSGGSFTSTAAQSFSSNGAGTITTTAATDSGTASGAVTITTSGAAGINLAGNITTTGATNSTAAASNGGQVDLTANGGTIAVADITTSGGRAPASWRQCRDGHAISGRREQCADAERQLTATGGNGSLAGNGNTVSLTGAGGVVLAADIAVDTRGGNTGAGTGGSVTFSSAVTDTTPRTLTVTAGSGTATLQQIAEVGANTVNNLSVTAGAIDANGTIDASGNIALTSTGANDLTSTHAITRDGTGAGTITLASAQNLFVTGANITQTGVAGTDKSAITLDSGHGRIGRCDSGPWGEHHQQRRRHHAGRWRESGYDRRFGHGCQSDRRFRSWRKREFGRAAIFRCLVRGFRQARGQCIRRRLYCRQRRDGSVGKQRDRQHRYCRNRR